MRYILICLLAFAVQAKAQPEPKYEGLRLWTYKDEIEASSYLDTVPCFIAAADTSLSDNGILFWLKAFKVRRVYPRLLSDEKDLHITSGYLLFDLKPIPTSWLIATEL